jgi:N-acetylglucosamine repressor
MKTRLMNRNRYRGANSRWSKQVNRSHVLNLLLRQGPLSRQTIAEITGLTTGAISMITRELLEEGVIREKTREQTSSSIVGRRPIELDIVAHYRYAIGVEIAARRLIYIVSDLKGSRVASREVQRPTTQSPDETLQAVSGGLGELLSAEGLGWDAIVGVGVGIPGRVDAKNGIVINSVNLNWNEVTVADALGSVLGVPIVVDNNVRCMAMGESLLGTGKDDLVVLLVYVGEGIGGAIVINQSLFRGHGSVAGELGHTMVDPNGPRCRCGSVGCLEMFASNRAIVELSRKLFQSTSETLLRQMVESEDEITIQHVVDAGIAGDCGVQEIMAAAGRYLGIGILNSINLLSPSLIVITGEIVRAGDLFCEVVEGVVQGKNFPIPRLEFLNHDPCLAAFGSSVMALQSFFY